MGQPETMTTKATPLASRWLAYLSLLRPKQWIKNGFVLAGVVFSGLFTDVDALLLASVAFMVFCFLSSAGYIFNDMLDKDEDVLHPVKRYRPIASGKVGTGEATVIAVCLAAIALVSGFMVNFAFGLVALAYFMLTTSYSLWLKHVVLVDLLVIAAGFVFRAAGGAVAVGVTISPWLLICTTLLSLFLGLGKRRHELLLLEDGAAEHRATLGDYSPELLNQLLSTVTAATLVSYSIYTFTSGHGAAMMLTIPFVLFGLFRYLYLIYQCDQGGSPEELLFADKQLLGTVVLWGGTVLLILSC